MIAPEERWSSNNNYFDRVISFGELVDVADQKEIRDALTELADVIHIMERIWSNMPLETIISELLTYIAGSSSLSLGDILETWEKDRLDPYSELRNKIESIDTDGLTQRQIDKHEKILADLQSSVVADASEQDEDGTAFRDQMIQKVDVVKQMVDQGVFIIPNFETFSIVLNNRVKWFL